MTKFDFLDNPGKENIDSDNQNSFNQDYSDYGSSARYLLLKQNKLSFLSNTSDLSSEISALNINSSSVINERERVLPTINDDDRVARSISDSDTLPWRMICSLEIETQTGTRYGTGWFAGTKTIITAGHNIFSEAYASSGRRDDFWAKKIKVYPGRYDQYIPYPIDSSGFQKPIVIDGNQPGVFSVSKKWKEHGTDRDFDYRGFDYGSIHLSEPVGEQTNWFSIEVVSDLFLSNGRKVNLAGYPNTFQGTSLFGTRLYHAVGSIGSPITERLIYHQVDATTGQSGSPVWFQDGTRAVVIGIYCSDDAHNNIAVRINQEVNNMIRNWIDTDNNS
jgi:glutamyl endopeptidase